MNKFSMRMAVAAVACSALSLGACWAEEPKKSDAASTAPAAATATEKPVQVAADTPAAEKPAEPAAAAPAAEKPAAAAAEKPADPAPAPDAAAAGGAASPVAEAAKTIDGVAFKDGRYRTTDGTPTPVVTKDYQVDWATWQGFRRYHDACHVCHGPNALGSTFAPGLADSLKTMDYATFYGTVVGGRIRDSGGTKYVMPAFGEDRNVMCYLDDIYSYIKARSTGAMPPGRPNGREDISTETKKIVADCTGP